MPARLDSRFFDRFDAYPSTGNIIAVDDGRVIGGVRNVETTELGTPADEFFDFADYLPGDVVKLGAGSWFCLERKYRGFPRLSFALMGMSYRWALSQEISHIVCPIRPCAARLFRQTHLSPTMPITGAGRFDEMIARVSTGCTSELLTSARRSFQSALSHYPYGCSAHTAGTADRARRLSIRRWGDPPPRRFGSAYLRS
jgi:hypothetical protein